MYLDPPAEPVFFGRGPHSAQERTAPKPAFPHGLRIWFIMRRILCFLLLLTFLFGLSACSQKQSPEDLESAETAEPTASAEPGADLAASASDAALSRQTHVPPASQSDAVVPEGNDPLYTTALGYVGQPLSALVNAIGQPLQSEYAASCEQEGAEDGMLSYQGFTVWTMRTGSGEIVRNIYLDEP